MASRLAKCEAVPFERTGETVAKRSQQVLIEANASIGIIDVSPTPTSVLDAARIGYKKGAIRLSQHTVSRRPATCSVY